MKTNLTLILVILVEIDGISFQKSRFCLCQFIFLCIPVIRKFTQVDVHISERIQFPLSSASASKTIQSLKTARNLDNYKHLLHSFPNHI